MLTRIAKVIDAGVYVVFAIFVITRLAGMGAGHSNPGASPASAWRAWTAMTISLASFALWMLARRQLGASFAIRAKARKLVTTGLYSRIRNPIYFFAGIAYASLLVAAGLYWWVLIFLLVYSHQLLRIRNEERVLTQAFGNEYLEYKARTWF